ncbi:uncharacterized protein LOC143376604 isoform X2 [Andrena cerasifolii]
MGAKYLNEDEFDSKEECLKFCCDTDGCDVFVFEEKKPGSCYLFQCGPQHDFKCKFTTHANYSSAVRINYYPRNNAQLEEEIRISQQEHELKSLRKLADPVPGEYFFSEPSIKLIATLTPKLSLTTPSPPAKQACSHNQYECRSSGVCIAIYNVCDGIPQCADGSDEAADLGCPMEKPTISPSIIQAPQPAPLLPVDVIKYQQTVDQHKSLAPLYPHVPGVNPKPWELANVAHQMMPQQQPPLLYPAQQLDIPELHKGFGAPGYQWDYQPVYKQDKNIYNAVNSYREPNNLNTYEQDQPHIFNHKGSSVIGEKEADTAFMDVRHPFTSHLVSPNRGVWQNTQVFPSPSPASNIQQKPINEMEKSLAITTTPLCDISHEQTDVIMKNKETEVINQQGEKHIVHEKKVNENKDKGSMLANEAPKFNHVQAKESQEHKSLIVIKDHSREHGRNTLMAEHLKQTSESEGLRPRGAVISLALGLTITAITAALIACRLRVVRRRGRRHGPYAHDADYLVNGMYL